MARVNYLNNKDILAEIHKSKNSYCYYIDKHFSNYDKIVDDLSEITEDVIMECKIKRAKKLEQDYRQEQKNSGVKTKNIESIDIDPNTIKTSDLVFRCVTYDHIPEQEGRVKTPKKIADYKVKLIFHPFKHFILNDENNFIEVGRSHWKGDLENGYFSQEHGKTTDKLGHMYMELAKRFAKKGNYRGYCVDEHTEALTNRGWLKYDQLTTKDKIMSVDPVDGTNKWSKIKSIYTGDYFDKMFRLTSVGYDTLITPNHKILTDRGLIKVDHLIKKDRMILMGKEVFIQNNCYENDFIKLVGWYLTEGNMYLVNKKYPTATIYQNRGYKLDSILHTLKKLNENHSIYNKNDSKNVRITLNSKLSKKLYDMFGKNKSFEVSFINKLSTEQLKILLKTMVDGDGWKRTGNNISYTQKSKEHVDTFTYMCSLLGLRTSIKYRKFKNNNHIYTVNIFSKLRNYSMVENINFNGGYISNKGFYGKTKMEYPNKPTEYYVGKVWCPETEYGTFICRRNGYVYVTGNTYRDEMESRAIEQLAAVGLMFNEAKSDNPFAYYTVCCSTAFTAILNQEKKNQMIRDDMIELSGSLPSMTRQVENEYDQRMYDFYTEKGMSVPKPINAPKVGYGKILHKNKTDK